MVTLQAKQQPPSQQQQQQQQQPSTLLQHRYQRTAEEDNWNGPQQQINGNNQNGCRGFDATEDWPVSKNLKSDNREDTRREPNFCEETTSSRSGKDARGGNEENARRDFDATEDWPVSNNLKSNNSEESRERREPNFGEDTTSSRSGEDARGGNKENVRRDNWALSNNLKSNNIEESCERREPNFGEDTTSSRSGKDARGGNKENGRRDNWALSNNLKSNNSEESRERREPNFGEDTTSSRSGKDARGGNKENGRRDNWALSNNLKSNNSEESCERREPNFCEDTTSSRSGKDARGGNKENGRRDNWALSNNLKSNNSEESRERGEPNFGEDTTSSRSGKDARGGNKENDRRDNWALSNNLKSNNSEESRERREPNFGEDTTSSRSGNDARAGNKENGRRDNWALSNNLKSNNSEESRERREPNFCEDTTSSRSGKDARGGNNGNKENGASRDNWALSNNLKSNNIEENQQERRVAEVANFREETTSSRSGKDGESTQCSDIEDDDDVEIEEELEEEEEEEGGGNYRVDEVDSEDDEEDDEDDKEAGNQVEQADRWIKKKVVTTRVQHQTSFGENYGQGEVVPHLDDTTFGEVSITNSKHVHVGNTNFYKGPVTIKQFVYTNAYPILDKEDDTEGSSSARVSDINPNDVPIVKCDPNGPILPSYHDYDSVTKWLWTWRCAAILCVVALILVTLVAVISVLLTKSDTAPRLPNKVPESPDSGTDGTDLPTSVRIIEREFWNAQPPANKLDKLKESPTPFVIISHTATGACETQSACVLRVRLIQTFHIESFKWDDIGYNFLIGGDGLAYVGRGWDLAGAHAFGYNYKSIGISFVGTFNDVAPNALQLNAAQKLIELGLNMSKIAPDYKLLGHRQVSKTLSPGDQLYNILQTWDHWSPVPKPEAMGGASTLKPHPAAVLPLLVITLPHLLLILQRSSSIFFRAARGFCNTVFSTHRLSYLSR